MSAQQTTGLVASANHVIDSGHPFVDIHCMAHTDGVGKTSFDIPPSTLAPALGFHPDHADMAGHLLHTVEIHHVDTPCALGMNVVCGDKVVGGEHARTVVATEDATHGYSHVAFPGDAPLAVPIKLNVQHKHGENLKANLEQLIKRGSRWPDCIGKSEDELMEGLAVHEGNVGDKTVKRVLAPIDSDHPVSRALSLNTNGHLSQYGEGQRSTIVVNGRDHVIMEEPHARAISKTLADNLMIKSDIARHGLKIVMRPLQGAKCTPGDVRIHLKLAKHNGYDVLTGSEPHGTIEHPRKLGSQHALALVEGGTLPPTFDPATSASAITSEVLKAKLRGSTMSLPSVAPTAEEPVLVLNDEAN